MQFRNLRLIVLSLGLLQIAAYYLVSCLSGVDGAMAIPQTDTLLYAQSARRVAEGCAFSYSAGAAMSTGSTTVLHPFLFSLPFLFGCGSETFFRVSFLFNSIFYLLFLFGWLTVIEAKLERPFARWVAGLSLALFGQAAYNAFAQTDIGLWLAFSGWIAAALAKKSFPLFAILLVVAPWVRPEGVVIVIALAMVLAFARPLAIDRRELRRYALLCLLAAASAAGVFVLNYFIAGHLQFSSLLYKGYFKMFGFAQAVMATFADLLKILKGIFLGLPDSSPRDFYYLPLIGGSLVWLAVFVRDWKRVDWREYVWILACGGGILTVAQSGWQNTNIDRYLAWLMPTMLVFLAGGSDFVAERFSGKIGGILPGLLTIAFTAAMAIVHLVMFDLIASDSDLIRRFMKRCGEVVPAEASVGAWADCGVAYEMPGHHLRHLSGIYSVEYLVKDNPAGVIESLKHDKSLRFDYWFGISGMNGSLNLDAKVLPKLSESVLVGPAGYELARAKWEVFDESARVPSAKGELKARVDVGYEPDERAAEYKILMDYAAPEFPSHAYFGTNGGSDMIDVGKLVLGTDEMTVDLEGGRDVTVVMRTFAKISMPASRAGKTPARDYEFANPLSLCILVDGVPADVVKISYAKEDFSDVAFTISGAAIKGGKTRIGFAGEHIACGYWFYQ